VRDRFHGGLQPIPRAAAAPPSSASRLTAGAAGFFRPCTAREPGDARSFSAVSGYRRPNAGAPAVAVAGTTDHQARTLVEAVGRDGGLLFQRLICRCPSQAFVASIVAAVHWQAIAGGTTRPRHGIEAGGQLASQPGWKASRLVKTLGCAGLDQAHSVAHVRRVRFVHGHGKNFGFGPIAFTDSLTDVVTVSNRAIASTLR
jgi:hypothetical protein